MQYLLTQQEMDQQGEYMRRANQLPSIEDLQKFCTFVSDNLILKEGWKAGQIWGCILSTEREWYCDDCPAAKACPYPDKHWSK